MSEVLKRILLIACYPTHHVVDLAITKTRLLKQRARVR
jgi:hypothetical protein